LTKTGTRDELVRIRPDDKLDTKEVLRAALGKS
jgi:hypothetical protein